MADEKPPFIQSADRPEPPADVIFYTVKQVAHLLELNQETVKKLLYSGDLVGVKVGGYWRISLANLRDYVRSL